MKFSILSGAYKNAGDFLIVKRCMELLNYIYPGCHLEVYERRNDLTPHLYEINQSDCLVLAGGPAYTTNIYPGQIPLVDDLNRIKVPVFALALGCKNWRKGDQFSETTMKLWKRIENDGFLLGCRDWRSVAALKHEGIKKTIMTGCAAWYDIPVLRENSLKKRIKSLSEITNIYVSDPASIVNYNSSIALLQYLVKTFYWARIKYIFHRGISADQNTSKKWGGGELQSLVEKLERMGIEYADISYGNEGFRNYDQCDLHIGYRVHAHIYNLSRGNCSILVEEDQRGTGVNEALGFTSVKAYQPASNLAANWYSRYLVKRILGGPNVITDVDNCLNYLAETEFAPYDWLFERIRFYFSQMVRHIRSIDSSDC